MNQRIYFMRPVGQVGPIKIGCSRWPDHRLRDISNWSPLPLELIATGPGNFKLERALHDKFADSRSHKEWFHPNDILLGAIAKVADGTSIEEAFAVGVIRMRRSKWAIEPHRLAVYGPIPSQGKAEAA